MNLGIWLRQRGILRWGPWVLFVLLLVPTGLQIDARRRTLSRETFTDFRIFFDQAKRAEKHDVLYRTDRPDFFMPGSASYKFPPPLAAFLKFFQGRPARKHVGSCLVASVAILLLSLALLIALLKAGIPRSLLMILIFLNWVPSSESLGGPQLEPVILLLFTLTLFFTRRGGQFAAGIPVGVAAAMKVYGGGLVAYFALRRQWRAVAGAVIGAVALLGVSALLLPVRHTFEYFFHILPRLGGCSLIHENLSALGNLGRFSVFVLAGHEKALELGKQYLVVLEDCGVKGAHTLAVVLFLLLVILLAAITAWVVRRTRAVASPERESLGLALAICLYVPLFPSSWANYQTLLVLPLLIAVALARPPSRDPVAWILIALAVLPALFVTDRIDLYPAYPDVCALARSLVPLWLWAALLRIYASRKAERRIAGGLSGAGSGWQTC